MDTTLKTSLYVIVIILSGVFLFSDVAMLSDIGKEYLYWDVSSSFHILYGFTALHIITILIDMLSNKNKQQKKTSLEVMYISVHQIGAICGALGFLSGVLAAFGGIVPQRFTIQLIIALSIIAIFPLLFYIIYWKIKLRKKPISEWWDEKNIQDSAIGALITLAISVPIYFVIIIIQLWIIFEPSIVFWILAIFFVQIFIYSASVLIRNSASDLNE
jgi:hypothetical protein